MTVSIPKVKVFIRKIIKNNNSPLKRAEKKRDLHVLKKVFQREIALRTFYDFLSKFSTFACVHAF